MSNFKIQGSALTPPATLPTAMAVATFYN